MMKVGVGSTAVKDAADAAEGVGDARPRVPFGGEHARMLVGRNDLVDSWYWPANYLRVRDETLFTLPKVVPVLAPFLKITKHWSPLASRMDCLMKSLSGTWSWSVTIWSAGNLKEVGLVGFR
jgi:hypothetical protein